MSHKFTKFMFVSHHQVVWYSTYLVVVLIAGEKKSPTKLSASQSQTASMIGAVLRQRVRSLEKERWRMKLEVRGKGTRQQGG